jgi:EmrB/QacA subfamily drug resistance transporter
MEAPMTSPGGSEQDQAQAVGDRSSRRWTLVLASLASLMIALDLLVVSTALSTIRVDLGASVVEVQWTVTAYSLGFAALLLTGAALGDRFGRRRMFEFGLGLFVLASAACAVSANIAALITARVVQGIGAALVIPVALALVSTAYPPEGRGKAIGILEGVTGLATIAGPILGGALAGAIGWQAIFWVNVPIGLVAIGLAHRRVRESFGEDTALDLPGIALVSGGALGLVWALVRGNTVGWDSLQVLGPFALGGLLMVAFVGWEHRASEPMLPMGLFGVRGFSVAVGASFLLFAALYGSVFFLAQFLQTGLGYGPFKAGLLLVPWTATLIVVAPLAGALGDRIGERPLVVGGLVLNAAGLEAVALLADPGVAYPPLLVALVVAGVGGSAAIPVIQSALIGTVEPSAIGKASGANNMSQELGGAFGVAILVTVFTAAGSYASPAAFSDGFVPAMAACAALAFAGALVAAGLPGRGAKAPAATAQAAEDRGAAAE